MSDSHEFRPIAVEIEESPVSPLGQTILWLVIAFVIIAIAWLTLGQIDVVITARGQLVPQGKIQVIQPLDTGVVRALYVEPGDAVKQGEVLMEIDPEGTEPALDASEEQLLQTELSIERIQAMLSHSAFVPDFSLYPIEAIELEQRRYSSGLQSRRAQLSAKQQERSQIYQQLESLASRQAQAKTLLELANADWAQMEPVQDLLSQQEMKQTKEARIQFAAELEQGESQARELRYRLSQLNHEATTIDQELRNQLLAELAQAQQRQSELRAQLKQVSFVTKKQQIVAPVDGVIHQRTVNTVGGVVTPAEQVMTLVPDAVPLEVEALVQNRDIGYVKAGMPVTLKIDTFDFQKYGTVEGTVLQVAKNAENDEQLGPVFTVMVEPKSTELEVDGELTELQSGMTVTAEIKTGQRRLIEFFIYPIIQSLDESFKLK